MLCVTLPLERAGEHTLLRAAESAKGINTHEALAMVPGEERGSGNGSQSLWLCCHYHDFDTGSRYVALAGLSLTMVDQVGLESTDVCLPGSTLAVGIAGVNSDG